MSLLAGNDVFSSCSFEKDDVFGEVVSKISDFIFSPYTIYLDLKKMLKGKDTSAIPDGYMIDMTVPADPTFYVVENEIVKHDPFSHVGVQMLRFAASFEDDQTSIRKFLMNHISNDPDKLKRLEHCCAASNNGNNVEAYLDKAIFSEFKGLVIIDEARPELHRVIEKINANISVLEVRCFVSANDQFVYEFDTLYDNYEGPQVLPNGKLKGDANLERTKRLQRRANSDTLIVPVKEDSFDKEFIANSRWCPVRIGAAMKNRIKHIAAFQVSPVNAVTHIAEVQDIKPYRDTGKYLVRFNGYAQKLTNPIPIKDPAHSPQEAVYTKKERLLHSKLLEEAIEP